MSAPGKPVCVYLTVDTELSSLHFRRFGVAGLDENFATAILGRTPLGDFGVGYQIARLDAAGHKAVFFVDPLVALVAGTDMVRRIIEPILTAGHDVQLHAHSEWLGFSAVGPTDGRGGQNMADFCLEDQVRILEHGVETLMAAGAPMPVAFRAGNYGANDDTLRALGRLGIRYDSSYSPDYHGTVCGITMPRDCALPIRRGAVIEVPVSAIAGPGGGLRHAQITALSAREMGAAMDHAAASGQPCFTIVTHSFELLCRERRRPNRIVVRRFEALCEKIAASPHLRTATYRQEPPAPSADGCIARLPHSLARTLLRSGEQAVSNGLYGEQIGKLPMNAARPAMTVRDRLITPLQSFEPFQQIALDMLMAV
jgi:hypothetical protein